MGPSRKKKRREGILVYISEIEKILASSFPPHLPLSLPPPFLLFLVPFLFFLSNNLLSICCPSDVYIADCHPRQYVFTAVIEAQSAIGEGLGSTGEGSVMWKEKGVWSLIYLDVI